jgi:hypothetical protein
VPTLAQLEGAARALQEREALLEAEWERVREQRAANEVEARRLAEVAASLPASTEAQSARSKTKPAVPAASAE